MHILFSGIRVGQRSNRTRVVVQGSHLREWESCLPQQQDRRGHHLCAGRVRGSYFKRVWAGQDNAMNRDTTILPLSHPTSSPNFMLFSLCDRTRPRRSSFRPRAPRRPSFRPRAPRWSTTSTSQVTVTWTSSVAMARTLLVSRMRRAARTRLLTLARVRERSRNPLARVRERSHEDALPRESGGATSWGHGSMVPNRPSPKLTLGRVKRQGVVVAHAGETPRERCGVPPPTSGLKTTPFNIDQSYSCRAYEISVVSLSFFLAIAIIRVGFFCVFGLRGRRALEKELFLFQSKLAHSLSQCPSAYIFDCRVATTPPCLGCQPTAPCPSPKSHETPVTRSRRRVWVSGSSFQWRLSLWRSSDSNGSSKAQARLCPELPTLPRGVSWISNRAAAQIRRAIRAW